MFAVQSAFASVFQQWSRFTNDDEARERHELSPRELEESKADVYGLASSLAACKIAADDEDCLPDALYRLDAELDKIPLDKKGAWLSAQEKCPHLVEDEFKSRFLWRDDLDAKLAAQRIVDYWECRCELFGPEKCFLPMTLRGALRDDLPALSVGVCRILPQKDEAGRAMSFFDPSLHDKTVYSDESLIRACWYTIETLAENDGGIQQRGAIMLGYPKNARFDQVDLTVFNRVLHIWQHCMPVNFRAYHVCHPDMFFNLVTPVFKYFLGRKGRLRMEVHFGSEEAVLKSLGNFGIAREALPTVIGGGTTLDQEKWLSERSLLEDRNDRAQRDEMADSDTPTSDAPSHITASCDHPVGDASSGSALDSLSFLPLPLHLKPDDGAAVPRQSDFIARDKTSRRGSMPFKKRILQSAALSDRDCNAPDDKQSRTTDGDAASLSFIGSALIQLAHSTPPTQSTPRRVTVDGGEGLLNATLPPKNCSGIGRNGDARMHAAVKAKLSNPRMSLLDALVEGGFSFPDLGKPGVSTKDVRDLDGVLIVQRKNQLNRRLRKLKDKNNGQGKT